MNKHKIAIHFSILLCFTFSCTTTTINSFPEGAEIYINGEKKGTAPLTTELTDFIFEKRVVTFKKDNVVLQEIELERTVKWIPLLLSPFGLGIPLLWIYGPLKNYHFDLKVLTWSDTFEAKNLEAADKKCNSIGFRLPSYSEMVKAYESGLTKKWTNFSSLYWTSTRIADGIYHKLDSALAINQYTTELYYSFNAENGVFGKNNPSNVFLTKCVK